MMSVGEWQWGSPQKPWCWWAPSFPKQWHMPNLIQHHEIPSFWNFAASFKEKKKHFFSWNIKTQQSYFQSFETAYPSPWVSGCLYSSVLQMSALPLEWSVMKENTFWPITEQTSGTVRGLVIELLTLASLYFYSPGFPQLRGFRCVH